MGEAAGGTALRTPAATRRRDVVGALRPVAIVGVPVLTALLLVAWTGVHTPMWRDEWATAMYASLNLGELFAATTHVDAVLVPYYLLMHILEPLLGTQAGLRLPSYLSFAATAAIASIVARRWWGDLAGLVAGLAVASNAALLSVGILARPYALSILFTALAVVFVDRAREQGRAWWAAYLGAAAVAVWLQPFAVLAVMLTGVIAVRSTGSLWRWAAATAPAVLSAAAILLAGSRHAYQIGWIGVPDVAGVVQTVAWVTGFSPGMGLRLDLVMLAVLAIVAALTIAFPSGPKRPPAIYASALAIVPAIVLAAVSWLASPVFVGRYLTWSAFGAALLVGAGAGLAMRRTPRAAAIASGTLSFSLLLVSATLTVAHAADAPEAVDEYAAVVAALESRVAVGDTLVVGQMYAEGGLAYGLATAAGDEGYRDEILSRIPRGPLPDLDVRVITADRPLRSALATAAAPADGLWVLTSWPPADQIPDGMDPQLAECIRALPPESYEAFGSLRLYHDACVRQ